MNLRAELPRKSKTKRRGGPAPEPKLTIVMTLTTLVLPEVKDIGHPTLDLVALNDPEAEPLLVSPPRLTQEDLVAYNDIQKVNFFRVYEKPVAVVRRTQEPDQPEKGPDEPPPPPPPPPDRRRNAHKFVVSGMGWLDDGPIAYVINIDETTDPPNAYRLNDDVDDGKLVLIDPRGIVVRVPPSGRGSSGPQKNYFYALGGTFKEREEISPDKHPEISRLLGRVLPANETGGAGAGVRSDSRRPVGSGSTPACPNCRSSPRSPRPSP